MPIWHHCHSIVLFFDRNMNVVYYTAMYRSIFLLFPFVFVYSSLVLTLFKIILSPFKSFVCLFYTHTHRMRAVELLHTIFAKHTHIAIIPSNMFLYVCQTPLFSFMKKNNDFPAILLLLLLHLNSYV